MGALNITTTECLMKEFKMICFSAKCTGVRITANGSVKFENKFVRDCPDCGHALFRSTGGAIVKDLKSKDKRQSEII